MLDSLRLSFKVLLSSILGVKVALYPKLRIYTVSKKSLKIKNEYLPAKQAPGSQDGVFPK